MKRQPPKLVLFDIDGTLVRGSPKGRAVEVWRDRLEAVFSEVHGVPISFELDLKDYNGLVDVSVFWHIAQRLKIPRASFEQKLPATKEMFHRLLKQALEEKSLQYVAVEEAHALVRKLVAGKQIAIGIITGNIEENAWLKLTNAGLRKYFSFGGFGGTAENREELVLEAIFNAEAHLGKAFAREEIIVIGDTPHDVRAAKSAGVRAIGVASGITATLAELAAEEAEMVVPTLLDPRVLALFQFPKT